MKRQLFTDPNSLRQLTPRESLVLTAAKDYQPLDDIATSLNIPQSLVLRHLVNIVTKLRETDSRLAHQLRYAYNLKTNQ